MKTLNMKSTTITTTLSALLLLSPANGQDPQAVPESITTPNKVETSIGTLTLFDGAPLPETAKEVYDYLDTSRAVDAFLRGMPIASMHAMIEGLRSTGATQPNQVTVTKELLDATPLFLTGNTQSLYTLASLDLKVDGPVVIDLPAGMLGAINDAAFQFVADLGPFGPDKGKGGKYLVLPPGYEGEAPEDGYFLVKSPSYRLFYFMRASTADGVQAALEFMQENLRVYKLGDADNPPEIELINISGREMNTIHANNEEIYEELDAVIQYEPYELIDAERRGLFASIGIEKGKPFAPDARMKKILRDAAGIGNVAARSIVWYPRIDGSMSGAEKYPGTDSAWRQVYVGLNVFFNGPDGHTMNSDARVFFHYPYTVISPAMAVTVPGKGSDYATAFVDSKQQPFDGSKTYKLTIPANVPVKDFWSVTLYDSQTRSLFRNDQKFPALDSLKSGMKANDDGSYTIYFAPNAPEGLKSNWLQTVPGKSWFVLFRVYGPLKPWIEKTWRPGEIELVE